MPLHPDWHECRRVSLARSWSLGQPSAPSRAMAPRNADHMETEERRHPKWSGGRLPVLKAYGSSEGRIERVVHADFDQAMVPDSTS